MKITIWSIFRDFVNSKPIGSEITRQEIINVVSKMFRNYEKIRRESIMDSSRDSWSNITHWSKHTIDTNRNMSVRAGYLKMKGFLYPGVYIIEKHFPSDYTSSKLRKEYEEAMLKRFYNG